MRVRVRSALLASGEGAPKWANCVASILRISHESFETMLLVCVSHKMGTVMRVVQVGSACWYTSCRKKGRSVIRLSRQGAAVVPAKKTQPAPDWPSATSIEITSGSSSKGYGSLCGSV